MKANRIRVWRKLKPGPDSREPLPWGINGCQLDGPDSRECHVGEDVSVLHLVGQEGGQSVQGNGLGPGESERYGHVEQL